MTSFKSLEKQINKNMLKYFACLILGVLFAKYILVEGFQLGIGHLGESDDTQHYNCNASKCESASGGTYASLDDCIKECDPSTPAPSASATYSCSGTYFSFSSDICLKNGTALDKWDDDCDKCHPWYSWAKVIWIPVGIFALVILYLLFR